MILTATAPDEFPQDVSKEALVRLADNQRRTLDFLRTQENPSDSADAAQAAIGHGKALQRYVVFDVSAAMPDLPISDPVLTDLISAANDFVRFGLKLKAGDGARGGARGA